MLLIEILGGYHGQTERDMYQNPEEVDDLEAILQRQRACMQSKERQTD